MNFEVVHVALRLRSEILQMPRWNELSVTEDEADKCIPETFHLFLSLLFGGQEILGNEESERVNIMRKNVMMCKMFSMTSMKIKS